MTRASRPALRNADAAEIPAMPAILLARKIATGNVDQIGALPWMGLLTLDEFVPEFAKWGMQTGLTEIG